MKEQIFMVYEAPQVELVEVQVEQGFAASDEATGSTSRWEQEQGIW